MMKIRVLAPVLYSDALVKKALQEYRAAASPGTEVSVAALANGTHTIEADLDIAVAQPETMRLAVEAEADGIDACTVACFSDPGVAGARERVAIPVIGEGQAALTMASLLGNRICVVTTWNQCIPRIRRLVAQHGFAGKLAAVTAVNLGVMDLDETCIPRVVAQAGAAVRAHGADVVVLGCTGTGMDMAVAVEAGLREAVGAYVPVIDPVKAAVKLAEACVATGMRPSKVAWPDPPQLRSEYRFVNAGAAA
jgi:allantoin racemase